MKNIVLISFHNQKALGIRYLEKALVSEGIATNLIFFKGFNSIKPGTCSKHELQLLKELISELKPDLIGLSVMTSLYLETVYEVNKMLRDSFNTPVLWGGVYTTLFPERSLEHADFVIRGEGEQTIVELTKAVFNSTPYTDILNLGYRVSNNSSSNDCKSEGIIINDVRPLCENIDLFGYPELGGVNKYFINNDTLTKGDPILNSLSFELTASRGCPYVCSYCCSVNIKRVYKNKGKYVRFRSVDNVIEELKIAKARMKNLKVIHFWDEIFSDEDNWVDDFVLRYKKEINLPFEIWGHPLRTNKPLIEKLVKAGLYKVVMGIQSGSPRVRKQVFHRVEKQEEIINASKTLADCKVPQVNYDFMLQHPFETVEDIKETYELCMSLKPPFELQLHGLNFLPGTDIVDMAIKMNILNTEELEKIMYSPIQEQYNMYWGYTNNSVMSNFWYALIFMTQFSISRPFARFFAARYHSKNIVKLALKSQAVFKPLKKIRYYYKKGILVLRAMRLS